ncbi:hypothetical protein [Pseudoxanthomonas sp. GM95]|uniref:hypothetical protein n=1 Tax=Pseudoxanthomonas sp. GM95 TaxID=1881043 RepID=UPI00111389C3|nr:hypothetical protein [Pseudoxanthomonas sp. GM95]
MTSAVAVAVAVAQILIFSAFKASRAPQAETAEEARVSERSEFPRRAVSGEEHRAPMQSIGECQAMAVLATFAKTKVARAAKRRESSRSSTRQPEIGKSPATHTLQRQQKQTS